MLTGILSVLLLLSSFSLYSYAADDAERPQSPIIVATDKTIYYTGEVVRIEGHVPVLNNGHEVNVIVKDADGETFIKLRIKPTSDSKFAGSFQIPSYHKLFPVGKWRINIGYAIWAARVEITVLADENAQYSVAVSRPEFINTTPDRDVMTGDEVTISSEVKNNGERDLHVFYIVQVKDDYGNTIFIDWQDKAMGVNEMFRFSISWTPELHGEYGLEIFAWDDMENPTPLSPTQSASLRVV